jgi:plastocyanin
MKLRYAALAAGLATAAMAAPLAEGATKTVTVKNFKFSPATVSVKKGDTVKWSFKKDPAPHNVKGKGGIKSKSRITTGTYSKRFTKKGTFSYICTIHPNMKGKVRVR